METREIKFRVFDKHLKTYTENAHQYHEFIKWMSDSRYVCEQFTGLTDKNGKEIYEGDVIKNFRGDWGVIVWNAPFFEVTVSENQSSLYSREYFDDVEVIGNIHENTELL